MGIRDHPIAPRSPWQIGHAERLIGSIRRECLDHVVILGEANLRWVLRAYVAYYNHVRPHPALAEDAPLLLPARRVRPSSHEAHPWWALSPVLSDLVVRGLGDRARLKAILRKTAARSVEALWTAVGTLLDRFSPRQCARYFRHAGYHPLKRNSALASRALPQSSGGDSQDRWPWPDYQVAVTMNRMRCKPADGKAQTTVRGNLASSLAGRYRGCRSAQ